MADKSLACACTESPCHSGRSTTRPSAKAGYEGSMMQASTRNWLTWGCAVALPTSLVVVSNVYYPLLQASGTLDPDADTIMIPLYHDAQLALYMAPIVVAITWLCLRKKRAAGSLLVWDSGRPLRSWTFSAVLGAPAVALAIAIVADLTAGLPWYENLWSGYACLWVLWLLLLRSALVAPTEDGASELGHGEHSVNGS